MGMTFGETSEPSTFVFFAPNRSFEVARFQRTYTWQDYQVQGVIEDLEYIRTKGCSVGWPSILIQQQKENPNNPNISTYDLGDGQQRIITITLLLLAIWHTGNALITPTTTLEEESLLNNLIPDGINSAVGLLAQKRMIDGYFEVTPVLKFQSTSINDAFLVLFEKMSQNNRKLIEASMKNQDENSKLYAAFQTIFGYLRNNAKDFETLKSYQEAALRNIRLSVLKYDSDEDMQRAFANMNSFGIALTESELIKSEIYGAAKKTNPKLANEIADYWILTLEKPFWQKKHQQGSYLDFCLSQSIDSYTLWNNTSDAMKKVKENRKNSAHYLRDLWRTYLNETTDIAALWESMKKDFVLFETTLSNHVPPKKTLEWELSYTYQIVGKLKRMTILPALLMKLRRITTEDELQKILPTLTKYLLFLIVCYNVAQPQYLDGFLTRGDIPFKKDSVTWHDFNKYLSTTKARNVQWYSEDKIAEVLSNASFDNKSNSVLTTVLIYTLNEQKRNNTLEGSLVNPCEMEDYDPSSSREHILPQRPRAQIATEAEAAHERLVGMLGNTLILGSTKNSRASNKPVTDKLAVYEEERRSIFWGHWVNEFLTQYKNENQQWGEAQIKERSRTLAREIAKALAPHTPNHIDSTSVYKTLLGKYQVGDKFYARAKAASDWVEFVLTQEGTLYNEQNNTYVKGQMDFDAFLGSGSKNWKDMLKIKDANGVINKRA